MVDFNEYQFRASQSSKLKTGNIGLSENQSKTLQIHLERKNGALSGTLDDKGKGIKPLTQNMEDELVELKKIKAENRLPKTMISELRKIFRSEKYSRNFLFTNAYVQKGIQQEEEAITLYQKYRKEVSGINTYFTKNTERLYNDFFSGEPDLRPMIIEGKKVGFDTKCSYTLESFPFEEDELDPSYECQNQVYMDLDNADMWITAYCLVNCTEQQLFNEKQKHFYALGMPGDMNHKYYNEYVKKCKEVEIMLIYDYDRFIEQYHAVLEIGRDEWFANGYDIPLKDRVIEKISYRDKKFIDDLKVRAKVGREYMIKLNY